MQIRTPGQKTKVACEHCKKLQPGTWNYGTFHVSDGTPVEEVMLASCDVCGNPCSLATQSAWRVKEASERARKKKRTSVMVTLPLQDLTASRLLALGAGEPKRGPELVTMAVLRSLLAAPKRVDSFARRLRKVSSPLLEEPRRAKMNLYLTEDLAQLLARLADKSELQKSEVVRRSLVLAQEDPKIEGELLKMLGVRRPAAKPD